MTYPNSHQPWMSGRLWVARQDLSELEWGGTHAADVGMPQAPWPHSAEGPAPASVEHSWHTSPVDTGTYTGKIIIRNTAVWQVYWFHVIQTIKFLHTSSCTYQPHTYIHTPHMDHTIIHKHCRYCKHSWMQPHTHTHKHAHASKPHSNPTKQAKWLNQKHTPFQLGGKTKPTEALTAK